MFKTLTRNRIKRKNRKFVANETVHKQNTKFGSTQCDVRIRKTSGPPICKKKFRFTCDVWKRIRRKKNKIFLKTICLYLYTHDSVHPRKRVWVDGIFMGGRNSTFYGFLGTHQFYICAYEKPENLWKKEREKAESLATVYLLPTIFLSSAYIIPPSNFPVPNPIA